MSQIILGELLCNYFVFTLPMHAIQMTSPVHAEAMAMVEDMEVYGKAHGESLWTLANLVRISKVTIQKDSEQKNK